MPTLYLIPSALHEEGTHVVSPTVVEAIRDCQVIFAENERTARRYLKKLDHSIEINNYQWFTIAKEEEEIIPTFRDQLKSGKNVAIISEAGCPGVADPGQSLVAEAQKMDVTVRPIVGPSSIMLALMASGLNGQRFRFCGYLPIREPERGKAIRELEAESRKKDATQIFIETPYRNDQLFEALINNCQLSTRLCIAADLTAPGEWIKTRSIGDWKANKFSLNKRPAIFLLYAT